MNSKKILLVLFVAAHARTANAVNYYFSSVRGDDSRSPRQASHSSTPWQSLRKLNQIAATLQPGDSVLFARGEIFPGSITVQSSGAKNAPIVFGVYGDGSKPNPVIAGSIRLNNWENAGGGIWKTTVPGSPAAINVFTIDGRSYAMGRYPNADVPEKGYLHFEEANSTRSVTDRDLPDFLDFAGAELVIKPRRWLINRNPITKQSGHTIYYTTDSKYTPPKGFGYFIQHHLNTLDQFGEWYYNSDSGLLYLFLGNKIPQDFNIQVSRYTSLLEITGRSYVDVNALDFTGANGNAIQLDSADDIRIMNCSIHNSGISGICSRWVNAALVENCDIADVNNTGLEFADRCSGIIIRGNTVHRCGMTDGAGPNGNVKTVGINIGGNNNLIEYNRIDSIGYIGVFFRGNDITIRRNVISHFTMNKDDGGGIYTVTDKTTKRAWRNRLISENIVMDGVGCGDGTDEPGFRSALGIYMDDLTSDVVIRDNAITRCAELGLYFHDAHNITATDNLSFDNRTQFAMDQDLILDGMSISGNRVLNNYFVSLKKGEVLESYRSQRDDIRMYGKTDSNFLVTTSQRDSVFFYASGEASGTPLSRYFSLAQWRKEYQYEKNSKLAFFHGTPEDHRFEYNATRQEKEIDLGKEQYADLRGNNYSGTIRLAPFTFLLLFNAQSLRVED